MPKPYASFTFRKVNEDNDQRYIADHAIEGDIGKYTINTKFIIPEHMRTIWTAITSGQVASAINAWPIKYTDINGQIQHIATQKLSPCGFSDLLTPRKIRLYFSNGRSTSIAIGKGGTDILHALDALRLIFTTNDVTIDCAHLIGEEFANLNDVAGTNFLPTESTAPAGSGPYYSGLMTEYVSDPSGTVTPLPIKIMSTNEAEGQITLPIIFLSAQVSNCIGVIAGSSGYNCPRGESTIEHRRIIVLYKTDANLPVFETRELPVKNIGAELYNCLRAIAERPGVACVSYRGESRKNIQIL